ncbi:nitrous oxide reductase accessory protein NosL [Desulfonema ishimotonii]|uniref:Nitrous oxide reductase accessory protein NosL n=1 Tax=Desulfonema ishimotonii TaxID=45657 RepID=A0A401FY97_9BACT|nr:nitrous oxide reductase accessory protein NosL [Desulfonema ishimotonii]GBC61916.1 nitrous oxide reductase accessory protein NosL [Desulfonema ishimotonii]
MRLQHRYLMTVPLFLFVFATLAIAEPRTPPPPSARTKCPVCGMFVAKYPDWVGVITFKDGAGDYFDGAKDLFKYYFNLKKYKPGKKPSDIEAIHVTEYYDMKLVNARDAFFVIGSDVYGPMGRELIPFTTRADAAEFMKDHRGKKILRFDAVTPSVIAGLD